MLQAELLEKQRGLSGVIGSQVIATGGVGGITEEDLAEALETKVDKVTENTNNVQVYAKEKDGTQTMLNAVQYYADDRNGVARFINGNLIVNTPTESGHATHKKYVDDKFNGANKAVSFVNYSAMITSLNALGNTSYSVGQNIMIVTLNVPDLWVSEIAETSVAYTYVSDTDFVNALTTNGSVQVGYYKLSALETQKVDLTDYVKNTDYATTTKVGLMKAGAGLSALANGMIVPQSATNEMIDEKDDNYRVITSRNLDYAVKKGLADSKLAGTDNDWTDEEKASARTLIDAVGSTDYATTDGKAGVIVLNKDKGVFRANLSPQLEIVQAEKSEIIAKKSKYKPITPINLDYAVKVGLTTNTETLTDEEKAAAQSWLGIDQLITGALEAEY